MSDPTHSGKPKREKSDATKTEKNAPMLVKKTKIAKELAADYSKKDKKK